MDYENGTGQPAKRRRTNYPEEFERIWELFRETEKLGLGARGSKREAYLAWKKDHDDLETMAQALRDQAMDKLRDRREGRHFPKFKHACRWFKFHCWEDEVVGTDQQLIDSVFDPEDKQREMLKSLGDRSWAE
jgi:hypothetical protein